MTCTVPILQAVIKGERQGLREAGYSNRGGKASSGELWRRERESVSPESGGGLCVVECSSKGVDGLKDRRVVRALRDKGSLVLYPAEGAKDVRVFLRERGLPGGRDREGREGGEGEAEGGNLGGQEPLTLIVLDGTWESVRRMYARSKLLQALPKVRLPLPPSFSPSLPPSFPPSLPSFTLPGPQALEHVRSEEVSWEKPAWAGMPPVFTVRKGPADLVRKGARSTAEAVALALHWLGGEDVAQVKWEGWKGRATEAMLGRRRGWTCWFFVRASPAQPRGKGA